jgi:hypothetical protein
MTLHRNASRHEPMREVRFDPLPPAGKIGVAGWQSPDGVQMLWQDDDGINSERTLLPRDTKRYPQLVHMIHQS